MDQRERFSPPSALWGQDLWNPELQMTALDGKQIQELLTVDEAQPTRTSTQYPSETHASWRELPLMYVDRLNWEGAARQRLPAAQWPVYDADYEVTVQPQVQPNTTIQITIREGSFQIQVPALIPPTRTFRVSITAQHKQDVRLLHEYTRDAKRGSVIGGVDMTKCNRN